MGDGWALFFELSLVYGSAMAFGVYQLYSLKKAKQKLDAEAKSSRIEATPSESA